MTHVSDRPRCGEHGLFVAGDGLCSRCRRHETKHTYRVLGIAAVAIVAGVLILSFARIVAHAMPARGVVASAPAPKGQLLVYTTSSCPHCRRAKAWLDGRGVSYVERRIDEDATARNELASRGRVVVPTFVIDDEVQPGMDAQGILLQDMLKKHGLL